MGEMPENNGHGPRGGLTPDEALELTARMGGLARAGLPMGSGLAAMAEELPRGRLRSAMQSLAHSMDSGRTVGEAIEGEAGRIPPHLRGLVAAGVRSGRLGEVLDGFSRYATTGAELRRRLALGLVYPAASLLATTMIFTFVGLAVVPQFEAIFRDFGIPLPNVTILVLEVARRTVDIWRTILFLVIAAMATVVLARAFLPTAVVRGLAGHLPIVGGVWRWTGLADFCHWLALLIEQGLPMPEALRLAGQAAQDSSVRGGADQLAAEVEEGRSLADAVAEGGALPPRLARLIRWGEKRGGLPDILHMAGEMFAARATAHSSFAAAALSVACFIIVIVGVNLVILGLMLPMITLISRLSG